MYEYRVTYFLTHSAVVTIVLIPYLIGDSTGK